MDISKRFNWTFRENILDAYLFEDIAQFQQLVDEWMEDYKHKRPHEALGGLTPDYLNRVNNFNINQNELVL
ncbi:hypothetical protein EON73_02090 [bacterium]|nr:MAG: hypothetical protein EON73_02090 [bacterium]